ncbi:MAG: GDP-mannose 4,6-dehydratase [Flavobacteriaceae bacterium]|nr:GDP-mannose 4,6-dehydratase [Flavobacteriaceae bacterium]
MKTIITGISGQDGAYLTKKLIDKGHHIIGIIRNSNSNINGLKYLGVDHVNLEVLDLTSKEALKRLVENFQPDYYYNLAAQSSVGDSFKYPQESILFNVESTLNALEIIRLHSFHTRFYQATSSDMFGIVDKLPVDEKTLLNPQSPYAISKAACHHLVQNYREAYNLKVCSGILFNHESVLRKGNFFVLKVIKTALDIKHGRSNDLRVGNIDVKRDFGFAPAYVDAMIMMMESDSMDDYIICSGKSISLRSIIEYVFSYLNISKDRIIEDEKFYRPSEIDDICGDNSKAKKYLKWDYDLSFYKVLENIIEEYQSNFYHV